MSECDKLTVEFYQRHLVKIEKLENGEILIELKYHGETRRVFVSAEQFEAARVPFYFI